jgi:hypothetical protein
LCNIFFFLLAEINAEFKRPEAFVIKDVSTFKVCEWKVTTFNAFPGTVLLRDCYMEMSNMIGDIIGKHKNKIFIEIVGSPGMGKSVFGYYLLWTFKTEFEKGSVPVFLYYYHPDIGCFLCCLVNKSWRCLEVKVGGDLIDLYKYEFFAKDSQFYVIMDGCKKELFLPATLQPVMISIASPNALPKYSSLKKMYNCFYQRMYYPLWEEQEFQNFKQLFGVKDTFSLDQEVVGKYNLSDLKKSDVFGRCPRYVRQSNDCSFFILLDAIKGSVVKDYLNVFKHNDLQQFSNYEEILHKVFFINSIKYDQFEIIFASAYLKGLVDHQCENLKN